MPAHDLDIPSPEASPDNDDVLDPPDYRRALRIERIDGGAAIARHLDSPVHSQRRSLAGWDRHHRRGGAGMRTAAGGRNPRGAPRRTP